MVRKPANEDEPKEEEETVIMNADPNEDEQKEEATLPEGDDSGLPFDVEAARNDSTVKDLRNRLRVFLSTSLNYEAVSIH